MKNFNAKIKELREDEECGGICDSADVLNQFIKFNDNEEPPDNLALGRSTWTLLHSMAANYPENPTDERQLLTQNFFNILAKIYPCKYCAVDFDENLQKDPPKVSNRREFSLWLCKQHNIVNHKLGKPLFNCTIENLDKRWRRLHK